MGKILMTGAGGGGAASDECTAMLAHVLAGETAVTSDSGDEPGIGTMTVNSLLSFSVAVSSGKRVLATWKNPKAAVGKPYSGVYIRYSTSGYPGKTGGTQIYKGAGNNTASEGMSSVYLDMPALGTTYYFSIYPYVTCSAGEMTGDALNASAKTGAQQSVTITSSRSYTVPVGYSLMDVFCVGGGSGGYYGNEASGWDVGGAGGGGGYTKTVTNIAVSSGQSLAITVGSGGIAGSRKDNYRAPTAGGTSSVSRSGVVLCSANGGKITTDPDRGYGSNGGSGGGDGVDALDRYREKAGRGGSNGGNGSSAGEYEDAYNTAGGSGQGTTTRAWGSGSGTLYAGGGGGGALSTAYIAAGGSGGGGAGGGVHAVAGTVNTGGGGGGGKHRNNGDGAAGGSGIVLIRFH